jgi:hypothetical protein
MKKDTYATWRSLFILSFEFEYMRTAKGARRIFTRQRTLPCALGKRNARHNSLPCVIVSAIKPFEGFGDVDHTLKELMRF